MRRSLRVGRRNRSHRFLVGWDLSCGTSTGVAVPEAPRCAEGANRASGTRAAVAATPTGLSACAVRASLGPVSSRERPLLLHREDSQSGYAALRDVRRAMSLLDFKPATGGWSARRLSVSSRDASCSSSQACSSGAGACTALPATALELEPKPSSIRWRSACSRPSRAIGVVTSLDVCGAPRVAPRWRASPHVRVVVYLASEAPMPAALCAAIATASGTRAVACLSRVAAAARSRPSVLNDDRVVRAIRARRDSSGQRRRPRDRRTLADLAATCAHRAQAAAEIVALRRHAHIPDRLGIALASVCRRAGHCAQRLDRLSAPGAGRPESVARRPTRCPRSEHCEQRSPSLSSQRARSLDAARRRGTRRTRRTRFAHRLEAPQRVSRLDPDRVLAAATPCSSMAAAIR